jgi:iron complex outermembrane receptor protein
LFVLQAGLRHTPYEGFANAQMDMVRNYAETLNLRYRRAIGSGTLEARVYWQNSFHEMNVGHDKSTFPMPMFMPMNTHGRDLGYSVRYELPLGAQHTLRVGNELHRFALDDRWPPVAGTEPYMAPDTFVNINGGHRVRLGSYAELGSRWSSKWTTLLGLRNDTVWTNTGAVQGYSMVYATDAAAFNAARRGKSDANIDLTAQARYDATDIASFEFGYARKSRAPNLYERYAWSRNWMASGMIGWFGDGNYYVGNIDLKPEIGHTFSGTLVLRGRGAHAWEVKLTPYLTYVQEYIDVNTLDATTYGMSTFAMLQFANHNARLFGGDVSGKMALWDGAAGRGSIEAIGNWVHGSRTDTGNGLYQMMPLNLKVKLDEQFRALTAGFGIEAVDRKSRLDPNRFEQATAGYALFNLHAGYRRGPVEGSFRVDNLFNRAYALPLGGVNFDDFMASMWMGQIKPLTGRGRSASLSLNVRL